MNLNPHLILSLCWYYPASKKEVGIILPVVGGKTEWEDLL